MAELNTTRINGDLYVSNDIIGNLKGKASGLSSTLPVTSGGTGATTAAGARSNLELGSAATKDASGTWGISITGNAATSTTATNAGNVTGTVAINHGGTGATSASSARSNLGLKSAATHDAGYFALADHTHHYAGSSSAGGAANSTAGTLTFAGAVTGTFNGSTNKTITIPTIGGEKGDKGDKGDTGVTPKITASASVNSGVGTPAVTVSTTGAAESPTIKFSFSNLKGDPGTPGKPGVNGGKGDKGDRGISLVNISDGDPGDASYHRHEINCSLSDGSTKTFYVYNGAKGDKGDPGGTGPKGDQGEKGDTGGKGTDGHSPKVTATASVNNNTGIPAVSVTNLGTVNDPAFKFAFSGLKGEKGDPGGTGPKGDKGDTGGKGADGKNGSNGSNGISVTAIDDLTPGTTSGGEHKIQCTLSNGSKPTFYIYNGAKGADGKNGSNGTPGKNGTNGSNGISVTNIEDLTPGDTSHHSHKIQCTLSNGSKPTFYVYNGLKGEKGDPGGTGPAGGRGPAGPAGGTGPRGYSITTIKHTSGNGAAGTTDTYSIYTDASSTLPIGQFDVYNGKDGGGGSSKTLYHHMVHIDGPDSNLGSSANITFECYSYQSHINSSSTISSLAFPIMCKGTFDEGPAVDRIDRKNNKYVFEKYQGGNFSQVGTFDNWEFAYATVTDTVYAVV